MAATISSPILRRGLVPMDIIQELESLAFLDPVVYRHRIRSISRDAAAEIQHLRRDRNPHAIDMQRRQIPCDRTARLWRPTPTEWRLLTFLLSHAGEVVTHRKIIAHLWAHDPLGGPLGADRMVKVMVCKLRRRSPWPIRNHHSVGYCLEGTVQCVR